MDSSSSFSVSSLCDLVSREKEDSRRWLRTQMNFLVDPLIEQLFDKLSCKLTIALEQKQFNNDRIAGQMIAHHHQNGHLDPAHSQMHQPSIVTLHPPATTSYSVVNSTPSHLNQQHANMHYPQQTPNGQMTFETINFNQLSAIKSYNSGLSNYESLQEIGGIASTSMQPAGETDFISNLTAPTNLDGEPREDDSDGDDETEPGDNDSDGVELVDDYDDDGEESDSVVKKSRMDATQSNKVPSKVTKKGRKRRTKRKQVAKTEPGESGNNNKEKQIVVHALQCLQKGCTEMHPEDALGTHMWDKHSIGQYRCVVKDCGQSYNKKYNLAQHLKIHQHITEWECDHCPKHFSSYLLLCCHTKQQHYSGQFSCSFPECEFTGEYREKVYNHFKLHHKPELMCLYPGCHYHTKTASKLKAHERSHQGIKPYRCKWTGCIFSSARRHCAINHIRIHLARAEKSSNILVLSDDPKDYLEVDRDLLATM